MRNGRLLYGERPIGVSLRPHFLDEKQFHTLTQTAQRIASALEKVATALVQSPGLMHQLGLTDAECNLALVDPGSSTAAITTRLDAFVRDDEIKFVEYNAENPSSLSDQEELNLLLFELPAMATFARRYRLRQFSPVERLLETLLSTYREWGGTGGAEHRDSRLGEFADIERIRSLTESFHRAWCSHHHLFTRRSRIPERRATLRPLPHRSSLQTNNHPRIPRPLRRYASTHPRIREPQRLSRESVPMQNCAQEGGV